MRRCNPIHDHRNVALVTAFNGNEPKRLFDLQHIGGHIILDFKICHGLQSIQRRQVFVAGVSNSKFFYNASSKSVIS